MNPARHSTVAPVFQDVLASICPPPLPLSELADYVQALKDHDWEFDYTDDHSVWQKGFNSLSRLTRMQRELDADFTLWNAHAPEAYKRYPQLLGETR